MTRTLNHLAREIRAKPGALDRGGAITVRGPWRARLGRVERTGERLSEVAAQAAASVECEMWPPDAAGERIAFAEAHRRLEALVLGGTDRTDLAGDLREVARALAGTVEGGAVVWWPLASVDGSGAVVAGEATVWGVWVGAPEGAAR